MKKYLELIVLTVILFGSIALTGLVVSDANKAPSGIVRHLTE